MKRIGLILISIFSLASPVFSQIVSIPDTAFLYALIEEGVDTDGDSLISRVEAEAVDTIWMPSESIFDLTGIESFINLELLFCPSNSLTSLDVSACTKLKKLDCRSNQLSNLTISRNPDLISLDLSRNQFRSLDLSNYPELEILRCRENRLNTLDISSNINLKEIDISGMSSLYLICVWITPFPTPEIALNLINSPNVYFSEECAASIPDTNFLNALLEAGVDTDGDGLITYAEAKEVKSLDVSNKEIYDLKGIEAFVGLDSFNCRQNFIAGRVDIHSTKLKWIDISNNNITYIGIWRAPELLTLNCQYNSLGSLYLQRNIELENLLCSSNSLNWLDVWKNIALKNLECDSNSLNYLYLAQNTELINLSCAHNQLTVLDVSNNNSLNELAVQGNNISHLNLTKNSFLTKLNISKMPSLNEVCVKVLPFPPDGVLLDSSGSPKVYLTTACSSFDSIVFIPDRNFLLELIKNRVDSNGDSLISYGEASTITKLNLRGRYDECYDCIGDMTGINAFVNLDTLICASQLMRTLDLRDCKSLKYLDCYRAYRLTSLDVSTCDSLRFIQCGFTDLTSLDVSGCFELRVLDLLHTPLSSLDLSNNTKIHYAVLQGMSELKVCVWKGFHEDSVSFDLRETRNVYFSNDCGTNNEGAVVDFDGNTYKTVKIGEQWWMAENLRAEHYADGTDIPLAGSDSTWLALEVNDKAYCWYKNNPANRNTYGHLYNWAAAMNGAISSYTNPSGVQGVCPDDWHLPSNKEWDEMNDFLGGINISGGKLKDTGYVHWLAPNTGATNSSGFTALPGGRRNHSGPFFELGRIALFWSTTEKDPETVYHFGMDHEQSLAGLGYYGPGGNKGYGISVRCVKDPEPTKQGLIAHYPLKRYNRDVTATNMPMTLINAPFENDGVYSNGLYKHNTPEASQIVTPYKLSGFDIDSFTISADFMLLDDPNSGFSPFPIWVGGTSARWVGFCYGNADGKHLAAIFTNNNDYTFLDTELRENQWYNAKISYDGGTIRAFLDEELIGIVKVASLSHNDDFNVGTTNYSRGSTFNGYLKNLKVYNLVVPYLTVSDTLAQIEGADKSQTDLSVNSNANWTLHSDQDWLSFKNKTGTGDQSITLIADGNPTPGSRSATVTISTDGVPTKTIIVTQLFDRKEYCKYVDISIDYSAGSPLCVGGDQGSIDITVDGPNPEHSFNWSTGSRSEDISGLSKGVYMVVVTDSEECKDSMEIQIVDPMALSIDEITREPLCFGDLNGSINVLASGGTEPYTFLWHDNSILDSISGLSAGCFTVSVLDLYGCMEQKNICISEPDKISIDKIVGADKVEEDLSYTYSLVERDNFIYYWIIESGEIISGQGTHEVDIKWGPEVEGSVYAVIESDLGCLSDTASLYVHISLVGIAPDRLAGLMIYPNPTKDQFTIEFSKRGTRQVQISSLNGQIISRVEMIGSSQQIDLSSFQNGVYFITIRTQDNVITKKIVKL